MGTGEEGSEGARAGDGEQGGGRKAPPVVPDPTHPNTHRRSLAAWLSPLPAPDTHSHSHSPLFPSPFPLLPHKKNTGGPAASTISMHAVKGKWW